MVAAERNAAREAKRRAMVASTRSFSVTRGTTRILFGIGASQKMAPELDALGISRVLVVATPGRGADASALSQGLGARSAGVLSTAREHVPVEVAADAQR